MFNYYKHNDVWTKYDNPDSQAAAISSPLSNKWLCPTHIYPWDYQFRSG